MERLDMKEFNDLHVQYLIAVERIAMFFTKRYFGNSYSYSSRDWVALDIGGVLMVNDHFFNVDDMIQYMKNKYTRKEMFAYYEYALGIRSEGEDKLPVNIKHWKKRIDTRLYA